MKILNKIQQELKAPKGQRNTFGNYNYRSCEDILEAVKPLLGDATLTITDDVVQLGDRYYVKATVTLGEGVNGKSVSVSAFARESFDKKGMDAAQITGAASSYARKYALNGLFCIDDTKDADTNDNRQSSEKAPEAQAPKQKTPQEMYDSALKAIDSAKDIESLQGYIPRIKGNTAFTEAQKEELLNEVDLKMNAIKLDIDLSPQESPDESQELLKKKFRK